MSALLHLCVDAGQCGDASGSDDRSLCVPDLHKSWGLRVGDHGGVFRLCWSACGRGCLFGVDICVSLKVCRSYRVGVCLRSVTVPVQCVSVFAAAAPCVSTGISTAGQCVRF